MNVLEPLEVVMVEVHYDNMDQIISASVQEEPSLNPK